MSVSNTNNNNALGTQEEYDKWIKEDNSSFGQFKRKSFVFIIQKTNFLVKNFERILAATKMSVGGSVLIMFNLKYIICFFYAVWLMMMGEKNDKDLIIESNTFIDSLENFKQSFSYPLLKEQGFGNWIINIFNTDIFFNFFKDLRVDSGNYLSFKSGQFKELENFTTEEVTPKFEENIGITWIVFIIIVLAIIKYLNPSTNPLINLFKKEKKGGGKPNEIGDGKPNDIGGLIKLFIDGCPGLDKYPGLDEIVDDILQYLVDIIGTIDKSNLDQIGIKPEDISKINVDYIKHIKLNDVKDFEVPEEFFDNINSLIDIFIGELKDIKAGAEERVKQMEEMKQSQDNLRYGNEFKQGAMGFNTMVPIGVGAMGGKQKRSRRKRSRRKHSRRKRSRRKRSRRKNRK